MDHELAETLKSEAELRYDLTGKKVLANRQLLVRLIAWLFPKIYGRCTLEQIDALLDAQIVPASVPLHRTERVIGLDTADKNKQEGAVYFDLLVTVKLPDGSDKRLFLDLEMQTDSNTGAILLRAVYYAGRIISLQRNTVFGGMDYRLLNPVSSTWFLTDPPAGKANQLHRFELVNVNDEPEIRQQYKDSSPVMINLVYIGTPQDPGYEGMFEMLGILFREQTDPDQKLKRLQEKFGIVTETRLKNEVNEMCNLSQQIRMESEERGEYRGMVRLLASLVKEGDLSYERALTKLGKVNPKDREKAKTYLKELIAS